MSYWSKKEPEYREMAEVVGQQPGISATQLAQALGVPTSTVTRRLPGMDEAGYLLYEDDRGKLWPFRREQ